MSQRLVDHDTETTPVEERRAIAILNPLLLIVLALAPVYLLAGYLTGILGEIQLFALFSILGGTIVARLLLLRQQVRAAGILFLVAWSSIVIISGTVGAGVSTIDSGILLLVVFAAGLLLGPRATLWSSGVLFLLLLLSFFIWPAGIQAPVTFNTSPANELINLLISIVVGTSVAFFATRSYLHVYRDKQRRQEEVESVNRRLEQEIAERRQVEERLRRRVASDQLTARIAADLLRAPLDELDQAIETVLGDVGTFIGVQRAQIFLFDAEVTHAHNSHEWNQPDLPPLKALLGHLPLDQFPWAMDRIRTFQPIIVADPADLPQEAAGLATIMTRLGIGASILMPLHTEENLLGFFSVGVIAQRRVWQQDVCDLLQFVNYVLANALDRRRQADALQISEQRYQLAATAGPSGIWDLDLETDQLYVSDMLMAIVGLADRTEHLTLETWLEQIHPDDVTWTATAVADAVSSGRERFELTYRIRHGDGSLRWLQTTGHIIRDGGGNPQRIVGTSVDVTERERSERTLAYQANLLEEISDAIISTDLEQRVLSWNRAAERIYGWRAEEALGKKIGELVPTVYWEQGVDQALRALQREGIWTGQVTQTNRENRPVQILSSVSMIRDSADQISGMVAVNRDITAEMQTQAALKLSEMRFRSLMEQSPFGIMVFSADGRLLKANAAFQALWGYSDGELVAMLGQYNILEDARLDQLGALSMIRRGFAGEQVHIPPFESRVLIEAGFMLANDDRWVVAHVYPLLDDMGRIREVVIIHEDITEQKRTETALNQAQKLESLGVLSGGVAHDFNNLLTAMLAQASLADLRLTPDHPAHDNIQKVIEAAERAAALTQQLLAYSGRSLFQVGPLDLNEIVRTNRHLLEVVLPKQVALHLQLAAELPAISGDPGQVQQVVMNLLINGAEAVAERIELEPDWTAGQVELSTVTSDVAPDDQIDTVTGTVVPPGCYVLLAVTDNGGGMDDETVSRIFDPFFSTKSTGRGLGLAAVIGIVRSHEAHLVVDSLPGRGTTFHVYFPAGSQPPAAPAPAAAEPAPAGTSVRRVLIVDDEDQVREAVADILTAANIPVFSAQNGEEGVAIYRQEKEQIGLVLLDLSMPGINGEETYRRLRQIDENVPVVLSSGYSEVETTARFADAALRGFLKKPYSRQKLLAMVRAHLR